MYGHRMSDGGASAEVFISTTQEDAELASAVALRLERDGISVWHFLHNEQFGPWLSKEILALAASRVAIFVLTPHAAASRACFDEAERVAIPGEAGPVPLPVIIGDWPYQQTNIWLVLRKWQAIVAPNGLDTKALNSIARIVHDTLGRRPIAALSTGQALVAVKDDLCAHLASTEHLDVEELFTTAVASQQRHRGRMVSFFEFTQLQRELTASELLPPNRRAAFIANFLEVYFEHVVSAGTAQCETRLASVISAGDHIAIGEYSRVILGALEIIARSDRAKFGTLSFSVISRQGLALNNEEPHRMAESLEALGATPQVLQFDDWIRRLKSPIADMAPVDKLLVGVEAFTTAGDVIFPQIVREADQLRQATKEGPLAGTTVIASGESYKVCRSDVAIDEVMTDARYTLLRSDLFDMIVTDLDQHLPDHLGRFDLSAAVAHIDDMCDRLRPKIWPATHPLPLWNLPVATAAQTKFLACDIDGTITDGGRIAIGVLDRFEQLSKAGVRVFLVTGRPAGWACALAEYLPGVSGVVAENGSVFIDSSTGEARVRILEEWADGQGLDTQMATVRECIAEIRSHYPQLRESADNFTRLTDAAVWLDPTIPLPEVRQSALERGLVHTFSNIHHHIRAGTVQKDQGLAIALRTYFGLTADDIRQSVITVGDGANDAPLFHRGEFLATVGVRSVLQVIDDLGDAAPDYVTITEHASGVIDLANTILRSLDQ